MNVKNIKQLLADIMPQECIKEDELLGKYTTFKIGGPADLFVSPKNISQLKEVVKLCNTHKIPYYVMGNGSNLLVSDKGFRGVIIEVYKNLSEVKIEGEVLYAEAGALLSKIATVAMEASLEGVEFAHGIPGTLGGAITMNAGAYGGEMKDVIMQATVLTPAGEVKVLTRDELELGYRTSCIEKQRYIVLDAQLKLAKATKEEITARMKDYMQRRRDKQPLEYPSAGSTFKRPEGYFAGKLIMDSELRGHQIGGARVSDKHCGFIINSDQATCKDVQNLIKHVQATVKQKFGVALETEVKMIGDK